MKKFSILLSFLVLLGIGTACNRDNDIEREESFGDEIGHELDEAGDEVEDALD